MTQKDYIKRPNPKASSRSAKGKKSPQGATTTATKPMPIIAMAIAFSVLCAFGYFLWAIKGAADSGQTAKPLSNAQTKPITASKEPEIPPLPKQDKWSYPSELKNKEVEVEVRTLEKKGPYVMQCATFKDAKRAEAFRAQLALLGFESRIKVTKSSSGGYNHRVQLGPYEHNRDAQKDRHKLSRHNINGCKIWLWS